VAEIELQSLKTPGFIFHVLRERSHWAGFTWNNTIRLLLVCPSKFITVYHICNILLPKSLNIHMKRSCSRRMRNV